MDAPFGQTHPLTSEGSLVLLASKTKGSEAAAVVAGWSSGVTDSNNNTESSLGEHSVTFFEPEQ